MSCSSLVFDTIHWLKSIEDGQVKAVYMITKSYTLLGNANYEAPFLAMFRQMFEPYSQTAVDMCRICCQLNIGMDTFGYSIELFDQLFANLVIHASRHNILFTKTGIAVGVSVTPTLGSRLQTLSKQCFDYIYWILLDEQLYSNVRDLYVENYARTLCLVTCIFIASKLQTYPRVSNFMHFLRSLNFPPELCQPRQICLIETNILKLVKFKLNLNPLDIQVESLLKMIILEMKLYNFISVDNLKVFQKLACKLAHNYYLARFRFLIAMFRQDTGFDFNWQNIDHIVRLELLNREKLLMAASIVSTTFWTSLSAPNMDHMIELLAKVTNHSNVRIRKCRDIFLQYLWITHNNARVQQ